jgi:exopolyphosphatase/guanosine-5'-triphosphate,3'-diphosphate pyrophosphatase
MKAAAVDVGTNSMRLLIADEKGEIGRWVEVTALGRGVDSTGYLDDGAIAESVTALAEFGRLMDLHEVDNRRAIATSASRDARNREDFFDLAEVVLSTRPELISGQEEAMLAYAGATAGVNLDDPVIVSDIGGGSTEFVSNLGGISIDIGSVRLTERCLPNRPALGREMSQSRALVASLFDGIDLGNCKTLVGVAGTWTSLAGIIFDLPAYDRGRIHMSNLKRAELSEAVDRLARMSLDEIASIPALDPKRASVILAGAVIAEAVMVVTRVETTVISEHDTLDAVVARLLALS